MEPFTPCRISRHTLRPEPSSTPPPAPSLSVPPTGPPSLLCLLGGPERHHHGLSRSAPSLTWQPPSEPDLAQVQCLPGSWAQLPGGAWALDLIRGTRSGWCAQEQLQAQPRTCMQTPVLEGQRPHPMTGELSMHPDLPPSNSCTGSTLPASGRALANFYQRRSRSRWLQTARTHG